MPSDATNKWLVTYKPKTTAVARLFCFAFAGGSGAMYKDWNGLLGDTIEVCPIELPGRWNRRLETPFNDMNALLPVLGDVLLPLLNKPFGLFGFSMGGGVAFEFARWLRRHGKPVPRVLLLASSAGPGVPFKFADQPIHSLPDDQFITTLANIGGIPSAVLEQPALLKIVLPALRADATLVEKYIYTPESPLDVRITTFAGDADRLTTRADLERWKPQSTCFGDMHMFPGGHFFLDAASMPRFLDLLHSETQSLCQGAKP